jgi:hypothetical protein
MTYRTRGQSGDNTETSVTASKFTLLHNLLLKSRRPRRTFARRTLGPGTGTSTMTSGATYLPDRRPPFTSWDDIARLFTDHLEVQRFNQVPPQHRATAWNERRKHAPWSEAVTPAKSADLLRITLLRSTRSSRLSVSTLVPVLPSWPAPMGTRSIV